MLLPLINSPQPLIKKGNKIVNKTSKETKPQTCIQAEDINFKNELKKNKLECHRAPVLMA